MLIQNAIVLPSLPLNICAEDDHEGNAQAGKTQTPQRYQVAAKAGERVREIV